MTEVWKPVVGWENAYEVSNLGRLRSIDRIVFGKHLKGKILQECTDQQGYSTVILSYCGHRHSTRRHRLVAEAFIPNPERKRDVNHLNGNKSDNRVENLEWTTHRENTDHAWETGLTPCPPKEECKPIEKVLGEEVIDTYLSIKEASEITGINSTSICKCCKGKRKSAGGFLWRYQEENR